MLIPQLRATNTFAGRQEMMVITTILVIEAYAQLISRGRLLPIGQGELSARHAQPFFQPTSVVSVKIRPNEH
jgi:hypothetical protein